MIRRPLAWACGFFVGLIYLSFYLPPILKFIFAILSAVAMVCFAFMSKRATWLRRYNRFVYSVASAALLAFVVCYYTQDVRIADICKNARLRNELRGYSDGYTI